jgi:AraC family transcriptional regulator
LFADWLIFWAFRPVIVAVSAALVLDQPNLLAPARSRRFGFGDPCGARIAILNGRGRSYEGGTESSDLSLKWMTEGSAEYESAGRTFRLTGHSQLLLNPGEPYRLRFRETSESFTIFYPRSLADAAWAQLVDGSATIPEFPTMAACSPRRLHSHLTSLHDEAKQDEPDGNRLIEQAFALLSEIANLARYRRKLAERVPALRRTTRDELLRRLARAEDYLRSTRSRPTLERAAEAAALSPFHLLRVFRAVHGETPLAFASRVRLEVARDALMLTEDSIEEISRRAGYESRNAFDRAFRKAFGATPGSVRFVT